MTDSTADRKDVVCKESPLYTSKWVPMCELARHASGAIIDDYQGEGVRIPTGFKCVDTALGDGFNPGELVVLASPVGRARRQSQLISLVMSLAKKIFPLVTSHLLIIRSHCLS